MGKKKRTSSSTEKESATQQMTDQTTPEHTGAFLASASRVSCPRFLVVYFLTTKAMSRHA